MTRPIYLIGHNTNSIHEIREGLALGLNAFEIDVNVDSAGEIYVSHDPVEPTHHGFVLPPRLAPFLTELRQVADADARMALVLFDCKFSSAAIGQRLLVTVRELFTVGGSAPHVIYSFAKIEGARQLFEAFRPTLLAREGLMIDQEADPAEVSAFFNEKQTPRACYGDGVTTVAGIGLPTPNLPSEMDVAVAFRAVSNLHFVYPWVLVQANTIREFLRIGVDGIMVDTHNAPTLASVVAQLELSERLHKGTRVDDPFAPDRSLLLQVRTADTSHAGTDAGITFTITAKNGTSFRRTIDGQFRRRFERGSTTCVTCRGLSLGPEDIATIAVSHDGAGNAPDWRLDSITLRQRGAADKQVDFNCEITKNSPAVRNV